jgi:hypothetical protein
MLRKFQPKLNARIDIAFSNQEAMNLLNSRDSRLPNIPIQDLGDNV